MHLQGPHNALSLMPHRPLSAPRLCLMLLPVCPWFPSALLSDPQGDKETFAYSMLAAGEPLRLLDSAPPGSAGVQAAVCPPRRGGRACRREFLGNTMVQHDPDGAAGEARWQTRCMSSENEPGRAHSTDVCLSSSWFLPVVA